VSAALVPVLAELKSVGFDFASVSDLRRSGGRYREAVPVLMRWLPLLDELQDREEIVRALSVPWARPAAALLMLAEFRRASAAAESGLAWAVGNALEVVSDDCVFDQLVELVSHREFGLSRQMVVLALGRSKRSDAVSVLSGLLDDEEVSGHAVMALGKLRAVAARERVAPFVNDRRAWVRKEAKKALLRMG
jgi:HEAT repeat protein